MEVKVLRKDMNKDIKVWIQLFFHDGSVTQGKYLPVEILNDQNYLDTVVKDLLDDTRRKDGVMLIWGASNMYAKKVRLVEKRNGSKILKYTKI